MTSAVKNYIDEYNNLNTEIKRLYNSIREFNDRKKVIEEKIIDYITQQQSQGIKYNEKAIVLQTKKTTKRKKKMEKMGDIEKILNQNGITNTENVIKDIFAALAGPKEEKQKLQFVDSTNRKSSKHDENWGV